MAKYDALAHHLSQVDGDTAELDFAEVAEIVDGLPPSAYAERSWWANTTHRTNSHAPGWMAAGWRVAHVDLQAQRVGFRRESNGGAPVPATAPPRAVREREVVAAARSLVTQGLERDGSVFVPGSTVWTAEHAAELKQHYVDQPDVTGNDFFSKLERQLSDVSDGGVVLAAELLYLNMLPLSDLRKETKRSNILKLLGWTAAPPTLPEHVDAVLCRGVFNGGVAFKTRRWAQFAFLIEFTLGWKGESASIREGLLRDPYAFRDYVHQARGHREPAQRAALTYLVFPNTFEPIVNTTHKQKIVQAFAPELASPTGDVDRDLLAIRSALEVGGDDVDFYLPPWGHRWRGSAAPVAEESAGRRAWLVRGSNVKGVDMVSTWRAEGWCSQPASHLPEVPADIDRDDLKALVDSHYQGVSYSQKEQKLEEFDTFLNVMQIADVVVTTSQGHLYLGEITGDAGYVASEGGRSNLRRAVEWQPTDGIDYADLPHPLPARLQTQRDILDLTQQLALLEELLDAGETLDEAVELRLPDATPELGESLLVGRAWLQECIELLRDRPQLIFYGPPGTGKTYLAQHLAWHLAGRDNTKLVQFHPAYSYEDFFEGYRPARTRDGLVGFTLTPGPFRRLVDQAKEHPDQPYVLIIDEINRGNLAKIFGELYFLLEYRNEAIDLLYAAGDDQSFTLPENVFVIGTMNTADRSIALVDAAMRRRFAFVALHPSEPPTDGMLRRWLDAHGLPDATARLHDELNARIEDPDFKIGPSYFMRRAVHEVDGLGRTWRTAILPLLEEHHYGEGLDVAKRYGLGALQARIAADEVAATVDEEPGPA